MGYFKHIGAIIDAWTLMPNSDQEEIREISGALASNLDGLVCCQEHSIVRVGKGSCNLNPRPHSYAICSSSPAECHDTESWKPVPRRLCVGCNHPPHPTGECSDDNCECICAWENRHKNIPAGATVCQHGVEPFDCRVCFPAKK